MNIEIYTPSRCDNACTRRILERYIFGTHEYF